MIHTTPEATRKTGFFPSLESRSIKRTSASVEKSVTDMVYNLTEFGIEGDLEFFLELGIFYDPLRRVYYPNPNLELRFLDLLQPIVRRTGAIDTRVVEYLRDTYLDDLKITEQVLKTFPIKTKKRRIN